MKEIWRDYKGVLSTPLVGFLLSLVLFFLGKVDIYLASVILVIGLTFPVLYISITKFKLKNRRLKYLENSKRTFYYVGRIKENGDFISNERKRYENIGKKPYQALEKTSIKTFATDILISEPKLLDASNSLQKIIHNYSKPYDRKLKIDDSIDIYKCLDYEFFLEQPLRNRSDFVEFEVSIEVKESSLNAFSESGALGGTYINSLNDKVSACIIAPDKYKIELLDYFVQDVHGNRIKELTEAFAREEPRLSQNDTVLEWTVTYPVIYHYYLVKYRLT